MPPHNRSSQWHLCSILTVTCQSIWRSYYPDLRRSAPGRKWICAGLYINCLSSYNSINSVLLGLLIYFLLYTRELQIFCQWSFVNNSTSWFWPLIPMRLLYCIILEVNIRFPCIVRWCISLAELSISYSEVIATHYNPLLSRGRISYYSQIEYNPTRAMRAYRSFRVCFSPYL